MELLTAKRARARLKRILDPTIRGAQKRWRSKVQAKMDAADDADVVRDLQNLRVQLIGKPLRAYGPTRWLFQKGAL